MGPAPARKGSILVLGLVFRYGVYVGSKCNQEPQ